MKCDCGSSVAGIAGHSDWCSTQHPSRIEPSDYAIVNGTTDTVPVIRDGSGWYIPTPKVSSQLINHHLEPWVKSGNIKLHQALSPTVGVNTLLIPASYNKYLVILNFGVEAILVYTLGHAGAFWKYEERLKSGQSSVRPLCITADYYIIKETP